MMIILQMRVGGTQSRSSTCVRHHCNDETGIGVGQRSSRRRSHSKVADRVSTFGATVFSEFSALSLKHKSVNLGQGFPDFPGPSFILEEAQRATKEHFNQYSRYQGHLKLVNALASVYGPQYHPRKIDPNTEVVVTVGATEGIFASIQAVVNPGEEVIMFEPFYDTYPMCTIMAGGIPKYIPLEIDLKDANKWKINFDQVEKNITKKTKMIIINTPQNIPGKVYSRSELEKIAEIAKKHDLVVLSDEVYEAMVYDAFEKTKIATLPGMFERTLTLGSAGWKVGWAVGPANLCSAIAGAHQNISFCVATPLQEAVGSGFQHILSGSNYYDTLREDFQKKRDLLCNTLQGVGLPPITPKGSYFVLSDISRIPEEVYMDKNDPGSKDYQFCKWLTTTIGVTAIPSTAFYSADHKQLASHLARFTFCKKEETLAEAHQRLQKLKKFTKM